VGDPQSAPPVGIVDAEIVFKPTTGMASLISASSDRPVPPPDDTPGSVDVLARPQQATQGQHWASNGRHMYSMDEGERRKQTLYDKLSRKFGKLPHTELLESK